ncbi:hypothetical protein X474_14675 [Dethiosulfatarculus sandiegensis]|uniref:Penicillin-binding protein transpeptidase domain-containing protein n=2 Tax=Dethiosulfatarculus sandiegensis TaxID=1429043 RepID=A0A0D2JUP2_9BACT|nr:hypothetical protein X474_14675 [Dethiosulfatarculus sandiegensis]
MRQLLAGHLTQATKGGTLVIKDSRLGKVVIENTLDPYLQKKVNRLLKHSRMRKAGVVVMDAKTGEILALSGVKRRRLKPEVALTPGGPAASLFKIVTAAAAIEDTGAKPGSRFKYAGRSHTLYRYQIRKTVRRKKRVISLKSGFAKSNNPLFARLGIYRVGLSKLKEHALALGFERRINFEMPTGISRLGKVNNSFNIGELASGYHRYTTTSPLHAAVMVAPFVNGGHLVEPYVVRKALGAAGEVLYLGHPKFSGRLYSQGTCTKMCQLMRATVTEGTARGVFRRIRRDRVLKHVEVGGKTGTLRSADRSELFVWFAGYGKDTHTGKTVAVATMVAHGKVRRGNPRKLARQILRYTFESDNLRRQAALQKPVKVTSQKAELAVPSKNRKN